jgi:hypothetical protein
MESATFVVGVTPLVNLSSCLVALHDDSHQPLPGPKEQDVGIDNKIDCNGSMQTVDKDCTVEALTTHTSPIPLFPENT